MSTQGPCLILDRHGERVRFPLRLGEQSLGRKGCDVSISDGSLSKLHAWITVTGSALEVRDAGSKNGVTVGDRRVREACLGEGDVFSCGKLRFEISGLASTEVRAHGPRLRLVQGGAEQTWWLGAETITLGCKRTNDIVITGDGVSRYHVEVGCEDGAHWLQDLGARNGVLVKGEKITEHRLVAGDEFQIGTCVLRYEVARPQAPNPVAELLQSLRSDPVGAFKSDARIRLGALAVAAALFVGLFVLPGSGSLGTGGGLSTGERGPWLAKGSRYVLNGEYAEARTVFRKAKVRLPQGEQDVARTLERISDMWGDLEEHGPESFRWSKASDLIRRTAKLKGLGSDLREWLDHQRSFLETNQRAVQRRDEAKVLAARARELAHQRDMPSALEHFQRASALYEQIPASSLLAAEAQKAQEALSEDAFKGIVSSIRNAMQAPQPDWRLLGERVERARPFALTPNRHLLLRRLSERCQTNWRDEARFSHAQNMIKTGGRSSHEQARALLEQIDSRSKIRPDAEAYLEWIRADGLVRQADLAYARADGRRAFELLTEALRSPSLGPSAKASITQRRTHWSRVVRAYERGMQGVGGGESADPGAREVELALVLDLEKDPNNRYRKRAEGQYKHLRRGREAGLRGRIHAGLSALSAGDYVGAMSSFDAVANDPIHRRQDLDRIRNAVAKLNDEGDLLRAAKKKLIRDVKGSFLELRDVFKLLAKWLPKQHPDRRPARKHLEAVIERINVWKATGASIK